MLLVPLIANMRRVAPRCRFATERVQTHPVAAWIRRTAAAVCLHAFLAPMPATAEHSVPLLPAAGDETREGLVRIINHSARPGEIRFTPIDDDGNRFDPLTLDVGAQVSIHFDSDDLEHGNAAKGLNGAAGPGQGDWHLEVSSELDIEVLAYVRTNDGPLMSMHDVVPVGADGHRRVSVFHPGDNLDQASRLRLVNATEQAADVTITGVDGLGQSPGSELRISVPAGSVRTLTAQQLESGGEFEGALGDGTGNWRLLIEAGPAIAVMNLAESSSGHLANLSSSPANVGPAGTHGVPLFPEASDAQGRLGILHVINHSAEAGEVEIEAANDSDWTYDAVTLTLPANGAEQIDSNDLQLGNLVKGLSNGIGTGDGDWRLALSSDLDIEVRARILIERDGFLSAMHHTVPSHDGRHRVAFFDAGDKEASSELRLINANTDPASVTISGIGDDGVPSGAVGLTVDAGKSRTVTADELAAGGEGLEGSLGDGEGWQLVIESDVPIKVVNLAFNEAGQIANLSTVAATLAPQSEAAFNDRVVGRRILADSGFVEFAWLGRFRTTDGLLGHLGSYFYSNTGTGKGTVTFDYDDGDACIAETVFESRTSGNWSVTCDVRDASASPWRLVETTAGNDRTSYEVDATIPSMPMGLWTPDIIQHATSTVSTSVLRIRFDDGGYVEEGGYRYTCEDVAGCEVVDGVVQAGSIVATSVEIREFDLPRDSRHIGGFTYGNGRLWAADFADDKVYAFLMSGRRDPASDFDLVRASYVEGIAYGNGRFYVVDVVDHKVYVYDASGQHEPASDFQLDSSNRNSRRVVFGEDGLYVLDARDRKVYAYRTTGERDVASDFPLDVDNKSPTGLAFGNGRFYVADAARDKVFAYRRSGGPRCRRRLPVHPGQQRRPRHRVRLRQVLRGRQHQGLRVPESPSGSGRQVSLRQRRQAQCRRLLCIRRNGGQHRQSRRPRNDFALLPLDGRENLLGRFGIRQRYGGRSRRVRIRRTHDRLGRTIPLRSLLLSRLC